MTETLPPGFKRYRVLPEDSRRLDEAEEPHFYVTVGSAPKPPTAEERVAAVWQSLGERDHFDWTAGIIDTAHTDIYGVRPVDLFEDNIHIGDEDTFPSSAELVAGFDIAGQLLAGSLAETNAITDQIIENAEEEAREWAARYAELHDKVDAENNIPRSLGRYLDRTAHLADMARERAEKRPDA